MMHHDGDDLAGAIGGWIATVLVAAVLVFCVILAMEIVRVYRGSGFRDTPYRRILWAALLLFVGVLLVALLLAQVPAWGGLAAWLGSLAFLGWVVAVEVVDILASTHEPEADAVAIDDVLEPWRLGEAPTPNGNAQPVVGAQAH